MEPTQSKFIEYMEALAQKSTRFVGSIPSLIFHTCLFLSFFVLIILGFDTDKVLLILTTIVSLEAIYLSIFIQMSVNRSEAQLNTVAEDIDEVVHNIDEIQEDLEEVAEDIEGIQKDVDEIHGDIEDIQEDMEEVAEDIDEIQKDVDEIQEDLDEEYDDFSSTNTTQHNRLGRIETLLQELQNEIAHIKKDSQ